MIKRLLNMITNYSTRKALREWNAKSDALCNEARECLKSNCDSKTLKALKSKLDEHWENYP